jgi:hypothetical protein
MPEIPLTKGFVALVDGEDLALVNQYKWCALTKPGADLVYAQNRSRKRSRLMHRLIMGAVNGQYVDHRDGNGLNNRRTNLRLCSHAQNLRNQRVQRNNTSGFKGVSFENRRNRWVAYIYFEGKHIWLGYFHSPKHAALAYNAAARRCFGEFANVNHFPITEVNYV